MGWPAPTLADSASPAEAGTLQLLDRLGRVVRTAAVDGRTQGQVPLVGLASGTYPHHEVGCENQA